MLELLPELLFFAVVGAALWQGYWTVAKALRQRAGSGKQARP